MVKRNKPEEFILNKENSEILIRKSFWDNVATIFTIISGFASLIAVIIAIGSLILLSLGYPEFPLFDARITPSQSDCFVSGQFNELRVICQQPYFVKMPSLKREYTINLTFAHDSFEVFDAQEKFTNKPCKRFSMINNSFVVCDLSRDVSKDYIIEVTLRPLHFPSALSHEGQQIIRWTENEKIIDISVYNPNEYDFREYTMSTNHIEAENKFVIIYRDGIPFKEAQAKNGHVSWTINQAKKTTVTYTVRIPLK